MIRKTELERVLHINGVTSDAPDEEIIKLLVSARYTKDEAKGALAVLRNNSEEVIEPNAEGLHKVFRTNKALNAGEISSLLGIEVDIKETIEPETRSRNLSRKQITSIVALSLMFGFGGIISYMFMSDMGMFHPGPQVTMNS